MTYFHFNESDLTPGQMKQFWGTWDGNRDIPGPRQAEFIARVSAARRAVFSSNHYTCGNDAIRHAIAMRAVLHVMTDGKALLFTQTTPCQRLRDMDAPMFPDDACPVWNAIALSEQEALKAAEDAYATPEAA